MELQKIHTDSDFSNAVIPEGSILTYLAEENGQIVTKTKNANGEIGALAGGGTGGGSADVILGQIDANRNFQPLAFNGTEASNSGNPEAVESYYGWNGTLPSPSGGITVIQGGDATYYKCASVDTANQTWTGYLAVLGDDGVYTFESTVTTDLTYGTGFTPSVDKVYNSNATIITTLWVGEIYIRFQIDAQRDGSSMQFSEIVLFDASGNEYMLKDFLIGDITYNENNVSPSSSEAPEKALDGDINTKWLDVSEDSPKFIQGKFQVRLSDYTQYGWYTGNDEQVRDPVSWKLMTSTDGNTWTTVSTVTNCDVTTDRNALAGRWEITI